MPLEALRSDTTPPGLHYVLTHFDIPFIDAEHWHLWIGGAVQRSFELSLRALLRAPSITLPVTLECAGNGRSLLRPPGRGCRQDRMRRKPCGPPSVRGPDSLPSGGAA